GQRASDAQGRVARSGHHAGRPRYELADYGCAANRSGLADAPGRKAKGHANSGFNGLGKGRSHVAPRLADVRGGHSAKLGFREIHDLAGAQKVLVDAPDLDSSGAASKRRQMAQDEY